MQEDKSFGSSPKSADNSFYFLMVLLVLGFVSKLLWPWCLALRAFYLAHTIQVVLIACVVLTVLLVNFGAFVWNQYAKWEAQKAPIESDKTSILVGHDVTNHTPVHLKEEFRTAHTQVIGTTNAGKTASVIMPWAAQDIEQGRGLLIIDGKADVGFLNKLYAYAVKNNRQKDFLLFSLANPLISSTYNPFSDGTPEQIAERTFSAFNLNHEYYGSVQFSALRTILALLIKRGEKPVPGVVRELLRDKSALKSWLTGLGDMNLAADVQKLLDEKDDDFRKNLAGLVTALGHFSQGSTMPLFNVRYPEIDLQEVILRKKICYFQLPTMQFPFLGQSTGKLVLQNLQSVISEIQVNAKRPDSLFSIYLDDFNDYIYPAFSSLLNKSRSANVGVVFSHQSLGDLEKVSPDFKQIVMTNTNVKVIMRSNDPDSAEQFARIIGTKSSEKTTQRRTYTFLGSQDTGDQSVREVEEYRYHPNVFKSDLGQGEGVVIIPHPRGTETRRVKFSMVPDLPTIALPMRDLPVPDLMRESTYSGKEIGRRATTVPC